VNRTYEDFLRYLNKTEEDFLVLMHEGFIIDCVKNREYLYLDKSNIHGIGVYSSVFVDNSFKWLAGRNTVKYLCGRFLNHSPDPNCEFIYDTGLDHLEAYCVPLRLIEPGEELTVDYFDNHNRSQEWLKRRFHGRAY